MSMSPDIGDLCELGERSYEDDEIDEAVGWYELACAGTYLRPVSPQASRFYTETREKLITERFKRRDALRAKVPWRSVQRKPQHDNAKHVLVVMTCPGREQLFTRTMQSLQRSASYKHWMQAIVRDDQQQGQAATFFRALRTAATVPDLEAVTLIEDDVVFTRNFLDYVGLYAADPDLVLTSWFSVETCTIPRVPPVLSTIAASEYMFNQALTLPAATVQYLLTEVAGGWNERHGADRAYRVFHKRPCARHFPSLAQHVGGQASLVGNNSHGERTSPTFSGEDADALALIPVR